jgi:hypothetical protein
MDQKSAPMKSARLYTTKRIRGGTAFQCQSCEYRITTLDFDSKDGNCRTQAATAMNQHAAAVHHQPMLFSSSNQQRN